MRSKPDPADQPKRTAHYDCAMCIAEMLHNTIDNYVTKQCNLFRRGQVEVKGDVVVVAVVMAKYNGNNNKYSVGYGALVH